MSRRNVCENSETTDKSKAQDGDVQSDLISNYREALKKGDRAAARSCLLAVRGKPVDDPIVANEIYQLAKADGDVTEAAKCFATIFNNLFQSETKSHEDLPSKESIIVINQLKDEIRLTLEELKVQFLKLKAVQVNSNVRPNASVTQSPMLSPRLRMTSEDRATSREPLLKLDIHLHSKSKSLFYQQLFDNLPKDAQRDLLKYAIETCDNPLERCRLIILTISIFNDSVSEFGSRLLKSLIELAAPMERRDKGTAPQITMRPQAMCRYSKSILVLDAIPLVMSLISSPADLSIIDLDELFQCAFEYYSDLCIEAAAKEYEFAELHEGLKKTIAARILGKDDSSTPEDYIEENLIVSLESLMGKLINQVACDNSEIANDYRQFRSFIANKGKQETYLFDKTLEFIEKKFDLKAEIRDEILFNQSSKEDSTSSSSQRTATPPQKSRGRPKKQANTVIVTPFCNCDDEAMKTKAREVKIILYSLIQYLFVNCVTYLKQTRSRVLINFDNSPLDQLVDSEQSKQSVQRTSRSKNPTNETSSSQNKKIKLEVKPAPSNKSVQLRNKTSEFSPLNSEQSRQLDLKILHTLKDVKLCLGFLESHCSSLCKSWKKFVESCKLDSLNWFKRINADMLIMSEQYDLAINLLQVEPPRGDEVVKQEATDVDASTLTITVGSQPASVFQLRTTAQLISCQIQRQDKLETLQGIDELLKIIKQIGLLTNDESYETGNMMNEFMVYLHENKLHNFGFMFFDALSLIRYSLGVLMDLLRRQMIHISATSDTLIGHTIVLSQFEWPIESCLYEQCINWLRLSKPKSTTPQSLSASTKFTYPGFFHYITDPNIIEDFMALLNDGFTLDIKNPHANTFSTSNGHQLSSSTSGSVSSSAGGSSSSSTRSKAITTRGVNKTFKEDLKVALVAQMKQSSVLVPLDLICEFVQSSLIPYLSSATKK